MRALPNMSILNPASFSEAVKVIEYLCETDLQSPHYLRLGRQPVEDIETDFEFGKGSVVKEAKPRNPLIVTIFSTGCILGDVIKSVEIIEQKTPVSVRIVNMPTLKPIDTDIIVECAESSDMLFTVEDHSIIGGLGSAVSDVLTEHIPTSLCKIGLNDIFPESAPPADLYEKYGLSANKIAERVISESMGK